MRIGFPAFIFALLASVDAFAVATTPAYKLGNTYTSETTGGKKCLEGHSGAMLGNAACSDLAQGCKNNSECSSKFGTGYVCAKGKDGNAKRGVCKYQECSGTGDTSCSTKYSHLRSCVKNELGVFECRITCNWQKIKEAGKAVINSMNVADRMKYEYDLWTKSNLSSFSLDPAYLKSTIEFSWYTCKNGRVSRCTKHNFGTTFSGAEWDSGNNSGIRYQPCLPCSIASGGTWGIGTDEDIGHVGLRAYSANVSSTTDVGHDLAVEYTSYRYEGDSSGSDTFYVHVYSDRCADDIALKSNDLMTKLNHSTPFATGMGSNITKLSSAGLTGVVELGMSDVCTFWHSRGSYRSGNRNGFTCKKNNTKHCLKSDDLQILAYVPKQNVTKTLPSASSPTRGSSTYNYSFNRTNGTLLCCRIGAPDGNDTKNNNIKNCIVIKSY